MTDDLVPRGLMLEQYQSCRELNQNPLSSGREPTQKSCITVPFLGGTYSGTYADCSRMPVNYRGGFHQASSVDTWLVSRDYSDFEFILLEVP